MMRIFLDYQSTTPLDPRVKDAMDPYWAEEFGNPHSTDHSFGWTANEAVDEAVRTIGECIGSDPDEIIITSGATEANNLALFGLVEYLKSTESIKRILVGAIEHRCVMRAAEETAKRANVELVWVLPNSDGDYLGDLQAKISGDVGLVSLMAVNNEIGTIQDITKIGELCAEFGVLFHTDAAQAPSIMKINVIESSIDLASFSGHKIYGPKGIGVLYVSRFVRDRLKPIIFGGGQQLGLRSGTMPVPLCIGMAKALEISTADSDLNHAALAKLSEVFLGMLVGARDSIQLVGPDGNQRHPGNLCLRFQGNSASDILTKLQPMLAASRGSACSSGIEEPSHVLRGIGLSDVEANECIRFSFGRATTKSEIHSAAELILANLAE